MAVRNVPRVKLVYQEYGEWAPANAQIGSCPHPQERLRMDGSLSVPCYAYCRDCGTRYLSPFHGFSEEEIADRGVSSRRSVPFDPDWVVAPGDTLSDWFAEMNLPTTIAEHYGISQKQLFGIFAGTLRIGPTLAQKLCNLTQVGAPFWLAMEHNYRLGLRNGKTRPPL